MKFFLKSLISPFIFLYDLVFYKIYKKKNCESSYKFLIFLFCLTGGMSNKILDFILSRPKKNMQSEISVIMNIDEDEAKDRLFNYGFYYKESAIAHQNISEIKATWGVLIHSLVGLGGVNKYLPFVISR